MSEAAATIPFVRPAEWDALEASVDHFICCDAPEDGTPVRTLCGLPSAFDGELTDEVGCVVCADLDRNDWCPERGRCPWGEPENGRLGGSDE